MPTPNDFYQPYAKLHETLAGPGDARPTALQVIEDLNLIGSMTDKTVLITGCNSGTGLETARALHHAGAKVWVTARTKAKAESAVEDIISSSPSKTKIEILELEMASLESVRQAASTFLSRSKQLNILVCNAGVMAPPYSTTQDGFELQLGVNHFAHFLLFQLLKPTLLASSSPSFASRVVTVASSGHMIIPFQTTNTDLSRKADYNKFACYGESKTANIWMSNEIERRYGPRGLHSFSVHPGVVQTNLARNLEPADHEGLADMGINANMYKSPAQGAATQTWCAVAPALEGKGGMYCSDIGVARPAGPDEKISGVTFAPHAYDEVAARELWELSNAAVGFSD